jgi:hypothetical protein
MAAIQLLVGGELLLYAFFFGVDSLLLQVYISYRIYARYLKWLTWALFAYVLTAFVVRVPWTQALRSTLIPSVSVDPEYLMALIAVLGTTISPYLFFWQTSQEVEDVRINKHESPLRKKPSQAFAQFRRIAFGTRVGMAFSNSVAFFIILTTAATCMLQTPASTFRRPPMRQRLCDLWRDGLLRCCSLWELLGRECWRFRCWPVRVRSFGTVWRRASLESKPRRAPKFYYVLSAATILGVCLNFVGMNPIRALFYRRWSTGLLLSP